MSSIQLEVDANYAAFERLLPSILAAHRDRFALMKGEKILGYFSTMEDARSAAAQFISDRIYSIQQVSDSALNMGFYTHAIVVD